MKLLSYIPQHYPNKVILLSLNNRELFPFINFFNITKQDIYKLYTKFKAAEMLK